MTHNVRDAYSFSDKTPHWPETRVFTEALSVVTECDDAPVVSNKIHNLEHRLLERTLKQD